MLTPKLTNTTFFTNAPEDVTHLWGILFWKIEDGKVIPYVNGRWDYSTTISTTSLFCDITCINRYEEHDKYFHKCL